MTPEQYRRVGALYHATLELAPEARPDFLTAACGGQEDLRREVESLLWASEQSEQADGFISAEVAGVAALMAEQRQDPSSASAQASALAPSLIGHSVSHYQVLSLLGAGGMGEVYLAEDQRLKRKVALKLLPAHLTSDTERVRRFAQEAQAASALNHPNIITIYDIGEAAAGRYIVMELVEGRSLLELIKAGGALDAIPQLGLQIARALTVAHEAGITHRDIKPENIMLRQDGYVKVLDFGLARLAPTGLGAEAGSLHNTKSGVLLGTVLYMSPEQARGETAGFASDIFSLGLIFYELATGRHPFAADSALGTLNAITTKQPLPPARLNGEVPAELEALILRMLDKDARLRPTAAEVAAMLRVTRRQRDGEIEGQGDEDILPISPSPHLPVPPRPHTVGRERELAELRTAFTAATAGKGALLCVAGEPGIGKTTLVEDFLSSLTAGGRARLVARGRCSERLAGAEAYLPWLEALDSLLRNARQQEAGETMIVGTESIVQTARRLAPTWYTEVAPLASSTSSIERLQSERASSQERMKREFAALLQEVSQRQPVTLFFDDLHWADASTIDLLAYVAGKFDTMRVLIVATYRLTDMLLADHPFLKLKLELQTRGVCRELALDFLAPAEVEKYLALEFPENRFPAELPALIHAKTEGNPLFMADLAHYLRDRGVIAMQAGRWELAQPLPDLERELPESVRGMVQRKIDQLGEEDRRLLVAASVQGYEFDSTLIAQALNLDPADVEEQLEALERVYALVRPISEREFPGHVLTVRYHFVHVFYQNALCASLRPTRRAQLSAAVAEAMLALYGKQSAAVAAELAFLFEAARAWARAAEHYLTAARNAMKVFANQEAAALAERGLAALRLLPADHARAQQELKLQMAAGQSLMGARGFVAPEVEQAFIRASELGQQLDARPQLFNAHFNLAIVYVAKAEYQRALDHSERCLQLAEDLRNPALLMQAHWVTGLSESYLGRLEAARTHFAQTLALHDTAEVDAPVSLYGVLLNHAHLARMLLYLGYPEQARQTMNDALTAAERLRHPIGSAIAFSLAAQIEAIHRHAPQVEELAEKMAWHSAEHGLPYYAAIAEMMRGWAQAVRGEPEPGIAALRAGLTSLATGTEQQHTYFLALLAEALSEAGQVNEGLATLDEAMAVARRSGERFYEAELHRLRGEMLAKLETGAAARAEACLHEAVIIARAQKAKLFELRATTSLYRLAERQGRQAQLRPALVEIFGWFTEGFDTPDLQAAQALLKEPAWLTSG